MNTRMMMAACALALAFAGCPTTAGNNDSGTSDGGGTTPQTVAVNEDITTDTTWVTGNTYILGKHVYVGDGELTATVTTLTIQPGVTIKGGAGTSLVVTRNGQLNAVGTQAKPIVFTSDKAAGNRTRGDWGGVVLLGRAEANFSAASDGGAAQGEAYIEGFPAAGRKTLYGAPATERKADWKCGELSYVRIEFAGYQLAPNNELNSLTLGACGTGTSLDYVQVHKGLDDGIECFGGAARIKHAVISAHLDDGLDWDNGFQGKVQFLIVSQEPAFGACGIEADNDASGSNNQPQSNPEVWNATFMGRSLSPPASEDGNSNRGIHLRRNTNLRIGNTIVTGFGTIGLQVESSGTANALDGGFGYLKNSIFYKNPTEGWTNDVIGLSDGGTNTVGNLSDGGSQDNFFDEAAYLASQGNRDVDPGLPAFDPAAPNMKPATGAAALTGGANPPSDSFFEQVTFVGAVGATDWTTGWTAYPAD